jgi:hypothetical protein
LAGAQPLDVGVKRRPLASKFGVGLRPDVRAQALDGPGAKVGTLRMRLLISLNFGAPPRFEGAGPIESRLTLSGGAGAHGSLKLEEALARRVSAFACHGPSGHDSREVSGGRATEVRTTDEAASPTVELLRQRCHQSLRIPGLERLYERKVFGAIVEPHVGLHICPPIALV